MAPMSAGENPESKRARLVEDETRSPSEDQPGTFTWHLNPAAEFHPTVLLPGDPARAMAIATAQLGEPRMFNHRRGLWGYSGRSVGGTGVVVQATGMGGPSAAIVCEELAQLGAETLLRVGTCGAIDPRLKTGDLVVVTSCIRDDGTSRELAAALGDDSDHVAPAEGLTHLLLDVATAIGHPTHAGSVASVDIFYNPAGDASHERLAQDGALAIDMECATVLTVARRHGLRAGCLLVVSNELYGDQRRLDTEGYTKAGELLGLVGVRTAEALKTGA